MMFDIPTLMAMVFLNAFAMAAALSVASTAKKAPGTTAWIIGAWLQALGWLAFIVGYRTQLFGFLSAGAVLFSLSLSLAHHSVRCFAGHSERRAWFFWAPVCVAVVHPLAFITEHSTFRIGFVAFATFVQTTSILVEVLRSPKKITSGWRWLIVFTMGGTACLSLLKLVSLATASNPSLESPDVMNVIALVVATINVNLNSLALLVAQRLDAQRKLEFLASTDALTGLVNRRSLIDFGEHRFQQAQESGSPLTVVMLDLDFFKVINDTHGHLVGDEVLKTFGAMLLLKVRGPDLVGRYGGEEFCIIMPHSRIEAALSVDQRIREAFAQARFEIPGLQPTFSAGAAQMLRSDKSFSAVLGRADECLYTAKQSGRAKIVLSEQED
ncbi:GGDEF domain-containing protein [Acidovorax sp. Root402]|uniref:GGDEF domain-containing protein n=1 Tax=Acidovorax sp. Root402 TaxID=1736527 RepID=UPI0006FAB58F|nr:GGDEF domain-containing protein [Acidovorax sp. Root402]KQW27365.1 hypothetical protein ASC83_23200 [Acidovorax sp. Root402]